MMQPRADRLPLRVLRRVISPFFVRCRFESGAPLLRLRHATPRCYAAATRAMRMLALFFAICRILYACRHAAIDAAIYVFIDGRFAAEDTPRAASYIFRRRFFALTMP